MVQFMNQNATEITSYIQNWLLTNGYNDNHWDIDGFTDEVKHFMDANGIDECADVDNDIWKDFVIQYKL